MDEIWIDPRQEESHARERARGLILAAARRLLTEGGRSAVTNRAVATAAGVQTPTIYRLFGDKDGLLDAVAEHDFAAYVASNGVPEPSADPVDDLRAGWDLHVGFGLAHPAAYGIMNGDFRLGASSPVARANIQLLQTYVRRIAEAGRLRVGEERATLMIHAAGAGTVLSLLAMPVNRRDEGLSEAAREGIIAAVATGVSDADSPQTATLAFRAALPGIEGLTEGERTLLGEWLDRISPSDSRPHSREV